jgi:toluene monooxygenase electron transfer component
VPMMTPEWPRPHRLAAVINHAAWLTDDVLFIRCEPERPIEFEAGQFVIVEVPGIAGGRAYSMVNFARPARHLDFVIKKKPAGCLSEWLFDRASGARLTGAPASGATDARPSARGSPLTPLTAAPVSLFGPLGQATFTPDLDGDVLCVAGGSGIAGMMSILVRAGQARHFERFGAHLFFGVRRARDLFFLDELAAFKREWGAALHLTIALSDEVVPPDLVTERRHDFAFDTGLVHDVAGRHMKGRFSTVRAWVAGPPPMVDATLRMLLKEGRLAPARIRYDKFS